MSMTDSTLSRSYQALHSAPAGGLVPRDEDAVQPTVDVDRGKHTSSGTGCGTAVASSRIASWTQD